MRNRKVLHWIVIEPADGVTRTIGGRRIPYSNGSVIAAGGKPGSIRSYLEQLDGIDVTDQSLARHSGAHLPGSNR
jgi:hypothetical protein